MILKVTKSKKTFRRSYEIVSARLRGRKSKTKSYGKRVDHSGRSVITPDPMLGIDEVGVPLKIAMDLTYPESVTKYNIDRLTKIVHNGPAKYPGAKLLLHLMKVKANGRK